MLSTLLDHTQVTSRQASAFLTVPGLLAKGFSRGPARRFACFALLEVEFKQNMDQMNEMMESRGLPTELHVPWPIGSADD